MADRLPKHAKRYGSSKPEIERMYAHLSDEHGISPELASERLHELKQKLGYAADDNIVFDRTGNAYDPVTLEWIGSLTAGGAKR